MRKIRKRFAAALLAAVMIATLIPASVWATYMNDEGLTEDPAYELGTGTGLLYQYYWKSETYERPDGTMGRRSVTHIVIKRDPNAPTGSTFMIPNYESKDQTPWRPEDGSVYQKVYIEAGVQGIGNNAFADMQYLDEIVIEDPSQLTYIGNNAFSGGGMNGNATFTTGMPESADDSGVLDLSNVTEIGADAFHGCTGLKGVTLGDKLTAISAGAFQSTDLTEIDIPESVTTIGNNAFSNPSGTGFTELTIPAGVTSIGANAFNGHRNLATVYLYAGEDAPITVGAGAFANCGTQARDDITGYTDEEIGKWSDTEHMPEGGTPFSGVAPLFLFQHSANWKENLNALEGKSPADGVTAMYLAEGEKPTCTEYGYSQYVFYEEPESGTVIDTTTPYSYVKIYLPEGHLYDVPEGTTVDEEQTEAG